MYGCPCSSHCLGQPKFITSFVTFCSMTDSRKFICLGPNFWVFFWAWRGQNGLLLTPAVRPLQVRVLGAVELDEGALTAREDTW